MGHRILGDVGRYGDPSVRKMVPLAIALSSISNPQLQVIDILTKYSHDPDDEVAANSIFGLGMIGAGTYRIVTNRICFIQVSHFRSNLNPA